MKEKIKEILGSPFISAYDHERQADEVLSLIKTILLERIEAKRLDTGHSKYQPDYLDRKRHNQTLDKIKQILEEEMI